MNKLTAEKCRERIKKFKRLKRQFWLDFETELSLQAYEIALPILEQQEMITDSRPVITDNDEMITDSAGLGEWIEWCGGECPVGENVVCETRWSSGAVVEDCAGEFDWSLEDGSCNIIAYRIIPERSTNQNGEKLNHESHKVVFMAALAIREVDKRQQV